MLKDSIKLTGRLSIKKFNDKNQLVYETEVNNLIVNAGKEYIASRLIGSGDSMYEPADLKPGYRYRILSLGDTDWNAVADTTGVTYAVGTRFQCVNAGTGTGLALESEAMGFMAIGDDDSTVGVAQTALVSELARVATSSLASSGANATFSAVFPAGVGTSSTIREAGIFNRPDSAAPYANIFTFDGDVNVNATPHTITLTGHNLVNGEKVTYVDGGGVTVGELTDGATYYVIYIDADTIQLAATLADAQTATDDYTANNSAGLSILITDGANSNHKLIVGTMLARTTFPVISKSSSESLAISWTVTVG